MDLGIGTRQVNPQRSITNSYVCSSKGKPIKVLWNAIQKCNDSDVQYELEDIHLNTPKLFTDYEEDEE